MFKGLLTFALSFALLLSACSGKKQNPLDEFEELRDEAVPPHEQKLETQDFVGSEIIVISPEKDINFVEGVRSDFKITARVLQAGVQYNLVAADLPNGASLAKSDTEANTWILSWQPPLGFTTNNQIEKEVYYSLAIDITDFGGDRNENLLSQLNKSFDFSFKVRKTYEPPQVIAISGLTDSISEGQQQAFTVDVSVPGAHAGNLPRLDVYFNGTGNSKEKYEGNGAVFVRRSTENQVPESIGNNVWRFFFTLDLKNNVFVDRNQGGNPYEAGSLPVRMNFKAYGPTGVASPEMKHVITVNYNAIAQPQCTEGAE